MQPQASDRPRFRQDLVAEPIEDGGARFIDVMDPDSGNLFRFYEVEYSLACAMDGERDVAGIVKWAQDELGMTASQHEVRSVIATLGDLGFIQPTSDELARGIVVGAHAQARSGIEVELGRSGSASAPAPGTLPRAPELTLGAPGSAGERLTAKQPVEDIALGAPGRSDVSVDLADQFPVGPADVKEALRQSKVMQAVEIPSDLEETVATRPPESAKPAPVVARAPTPRPEPVVARVPTPRPEPTPLPRSPEPLRPPVVERPAVTTRPPVELPKTPVVEKKPPVVPPAPSAGGVSPVLVGALIIVAVAAAGFLIWKYVIQKDDTTAQTTPAPTKPTPPTPPAPPPASKVVMEVPQPDDIKANTAGTIETIVAADTAIRAGEVVVKLVGDKPLEADIAKITTDEKKVQTEIDNANKQRDAAQAAGNKAAETAAQNKIDEAQKTLTAKQTALATKTSDLDKFLIHAPGDGKITPVAKANAKVAADDIIAKLQRPASPVATFPVKDTKAFTPNASVNVHKGDQKVSCTVAGVEAGTVKVACPAESPLADGDSVLLHVPGMPEPVAPPAPVPTPAPTPTPAPAPAGSAGSAAPAATPPPAPAGSAAPAGSGAPAAPPPELPPSQPPGKNGNA